MSLAFIFHTHPRQTKNALNIFGHIVYKFKILDKPFVALDCTHCEDLESGQNSID